MVETSVGKGRLFLMAPEVLFRSQPHGNYKLFFNGLFLSMAPTLTARKRRRSLTARVTVSVSVNACDGRTRQRCRW